MKEKLRYFFRQETVLCIAFILAICSMFFVPPSMEYITYVDFRTLAILFCLMITMAELRRTGIFQWVAQSFLGKVRKSWQLIWLLILLCFFSSMAVTNDVALITFVPFTFIVLDLMGAEAKKKLLVPVVVLQTIAANLGSMLTPVGNPQNLYLYGRAGLSLGDFILLMLPYALLSLLLLLIWGSLRSKTYPAPIQVIFREKVCLSQKKAPLIVCTLLFLLNLLTVARIIPCWLTLILSILLFILTDRSVFALVDYSLLLTFVGFFIFVGNIGRIPAFYGLLQKIVTGNELIAGVAASQVMSNVPAALLLSGFTTDLPPLIVGVNIGGLGTLIASMASLISYKFVVREESDTKGVYFRSFTVTNLCFLALLLLFSMIYA